MKIKTRAALACIVVLFLVPALFASGKKEIPAQGEKPIVAVSILPQAYFVRQIAGSLVDVVVLVGEGQSPHAYEPTPRQMAQLAQAGCWVLSGTDFEISLLPKISALYPKLKIVDGTQGVVFRSLDQHDHEGEQTASPQGIEIDRHTWLGWENSLILSSHVKDLLIEMLPGQRETLESNYSQLVQDINDTFEELKVSLAQLKGRTVFVYHPSFGYFFDAFGIVQEAVETGGKEPTAKGLGDLIAKAKEDQVAAIFVQVQFPVQAATTVAEAVGAQVIALDPLAEDWLDNIRQMGKALLFATER
jgi:zinc transport system substrate-binding protein